MDSLRHCDLSGYFGMQPAAKTPPFASRSAYWLDEIDATTGSRWSDARRKVYAAEDSAYVSTPRV
jgi:hypothetical protein